jgi:ankyrin repeat protein
MADQERFAAAVWDGDLQTVEAMIAAGADVNAPNEEGQQPPLHLAIEQQWSQIVLRLIEAGADVNLAVGEDWTPLVHAIDIESDVASQAGKPPDEVSTELVELLLNFGAKPTERAFILASAYRNEKALKLLKGAAQAQRHA